MKKGLRLRDIMKTSLLSFPAELEINRAMQLLLEWDVSGAPVLDVGGNLLGILSQKDCLQAALNAHYHQSWGGQVQDYMTTNVDTLEADLDLVDAANSFVQSNYRRFPVMDNNSMVGSVSRRDILLALSEQWN